MITKFSSDVAAAIVSAGTRFGVEAPFLAAIVRQESGGNPWAVRYEPGYAWLYDIDASAPFRGMLNPKTFPAPDGVSGETEWVSQKCSWGLGQVMGAVARELLFPGRFLSELCLPDVGAEYAARLIARLKHRYKELPDIASAYNAGSSTPKNVDSYVTPVMKYYETFRTSGF